MSGIQKDNSYQKPPETTRRRACRCGVDQLIQFYRPLGFDGYNGIGKFYQILLLQFEEPLTDVLGFRLRRIDDSNEIRHENNPRK